MPLPHLIMSIFPTVYALHTMPDECGLPQSFIEVDEETGVRNTITFTEILLPEPINDTKGPGKNFRLYSIDNSE